MYTIILAYVNSSADASANIYCVVLEV